MVPFKNLTMRAYQITLRSSVVMVSIMTVMARLMREYPAWVSLVELVLALVLRTELHSVSLLKTGLSVALEVDPHVQKLVMDVMMTVTVGSMSSCPTQG